ncbi:phosphoglycerate mutase family protein [Klebsormidium nitens]|uniref:Phosphoglycerate mutase family protein n=1 Tax=Klebsormidium nitens TaxID=105231 RepID=A0A1Y1IFH6_KLENI|nr:phosphoglycerate mutase family protein [Klebsormidium nitens]|eukprot:GAQ87477.1 phosphoglycerate mutase family protein [Klebsormidium nitens]
MEAPAKLQNCYWILRHGLSKPNEAGLIVSSVDNGVMPEHGLADAGKEQAKQAGRTLRNALVAEKVDVRTLSIFASPFSRTQETAAIAAAELAQDGEGPESPSIQEAIELRERYFGPDFELRSHEKYPEIWAMDAKDPSVGPTGGESVLDVAARLQALVRKVESQTSGRHVLFVSHGDTLQILQALLSGAFLSQSLLAGSVETVVLKALSTHRTFALGTGELRRLAIAPNESDA